ncbi:hypothetical protein SBOR_4740 [Sclerotinia borealis F-4128]|uniref:Uncharacterized protein n=1 Tax=Sclerotinia borealis (strain F-4128) TaxID=1432307 RepID=W9CJP0_SCLBF|nr:hypothetical protein SBOR_4740 [Sclerotinia borealis F-4128]
MTSVQGYYSNYERSIVPQSLRAGPLSSKPNVDSSLKKSNTRFVTNRKPLPKPRPQEEVRPNLPIPVPANKPAGYYLVLQRSRSKNIQLETQIIRPLPERKGGPQFAFGCLPNKKPRAGPQYQQPSVRPKQDDIEPPTVKQPPQSKFGYYPIYERAPGLVESLKQQTTPKLTSTTEVPQLSIPKKNPRGRYPDYELS